MALYNRNNTNFVKANKNTPNISLVNYANTLLQRSKIKKLLNYVLALMDCLHKSVVFDSKYKGMVKHYITIFTGLLKKLKDTYTKFRYNIIKENFRRFSW